MLKSFFLKLSKRMLDDDFGDDNCETFGDLLLEVVSADDDISILKVAASGDDTQNTS